MSVEWSNFYTNVSYFMLLYLAMVLLKIQSPGLLLLMFLLLVCGATYSLFLFESAFMAYLLFLVYVGGLLVLLIYLIMMSSNTSSMLPLVHYFLYLSFAGVLFSSIWSISFSSPCPYMCSNTDQSSLEYSGLLMLGGLLTYMFLNICNMVSIGGSLKIGGTT